MIWDQYFLLLPSFAQIHDLQFLNDQKMPKKGYRDTSRDLRQDNSASNSNGDRINIEIYHLKKKMKKIWKI